MQGTNRSEEGRESLLCDPGSELRLAGREKQMVKTISCCGCDATFNTTMLVVLYLNTSFTAFVCAASFSAGSHSVGRGRNCLPRPRRTDDAKKSK